jgi:MOB kinase activator 1
MDWIQALLDNEKIFPSRTDVPFPKHFESVVKQIFKKLFRVYAHIYYSHFQVCLFFIFYFFNFSIFLVSLFF